MEKCKDVTRALSFFREAQDKLRQGLYDEAIRAFRVAGDLGISSGYIFAADLAHHENKIDESRELMSKAEVLADGGDAHANLGLHLAHQSWYGSGSLDESNKKANFYLQRAAELGDETAQNILANEKLFGLNDQIQSIDEYNRWINLAIDNGSIDALIGHCKNALEFGWEIDGRHRKMLSEAASKSPRAQELLRRISGDVRRQNKRDRIWRP